MIISRSDLPDIRAVLRDHIIVFTSGSFDILHAGHIEFIDWCRAQGDVLFIGLNSDAIIRQKKGRARPVTPIDQRLAIMNGLRSVDYVLAVDGDDSKTMPWLATAETLRPDICVLGPDWAHKEYAAWKLRLPAASILVSPARIGPSTTAIIRKIRSR